MHQSEDVGCLETGFVRKAKGSSGKVSAALDSAGLNRGSIWPSAWACGAPGISGVLAMHMSFSLDVN